MTALKAVAVPQMDLFASDPFAGFDVHSYDRYLVCFSGGKDSLAVLLWLLEQGVPRERIELHHHDVDGREGSRLFDWPVTRSYCRHVAQAFGVPIYFSWRCGGIEGEMLREDSRRQPAKFETPEGDVISVGGDGGKIGTRRKFPQVAADLKTRWCSGVVKVDVFRSLLCNQPRFQEGRTLVLTGERAAESANRARYTPFKPHDSDNRDGARVRRHIDHLMPVHAWSEKEVWGIIRRWGVVPHPAYRLGWGRCSCACCIFGSAAQWASLAVANPEQFEAVAAYEEEFGVTIQRTESVRQRAARGRAYDMDPAVIALALSEDHYEPVVIDPNAWTLPAGAYGENDGPC